jgi:hypothetical protein
VCDSPKIRRGFQTTKKYFLYARDGILILPITTKQNPYADIDAVGIVVIIEIAETLTPQGI